MLVDPQDAFQHGFLYPTRHIYDGSSQFHFQLAAKAAAAASSARSKGSSRGAFVDPPSLSNNNVVEVDADADGSTSTVSKNGAVFKGRVLHTVVGPGDVLVIPSSWLVQCVALPPTAATSDMTTESPNGVDRNDEDKDDDNDNNNASHRRGGGLPVSLALRVSSTSNAQVCSCVCWFGRFVTQDQLRNSST